ncbi:unnamed protein product [Spirodela intermedia]|uniref:Uncharacterized protein n=1 Tax=Spirodela intermedia TaxID=51605 RepID=A0A7I8K5N7_SPIIN|nr:unnamed protein product [Spirodela intermedia]
MEVATPKGEMQLTRIPCAPSSQAAFLVRPTMACLEAV